MTPSELQRRVKAALENVAAPVTKDYREYDGTYPHIVYSEISNVPAFFGDNRELFFRSVYQVAIVTDNDDYEILESAVENVMLELGFIRTSAQDIFDGNFNRVLRFTISVPKNF